MTDFDTALQRRARHHMVICVTRGAPIIFQREITGLRDLRQTSIAGRIQARQGSATSYASMLTLHAADRAEPLGRLIADSEPGRAMHGR